MPGGGVWHSGGVDLDAFIALNEAQWSRLESLTRRRVLTGPEADELATLYQATAGHLSVVRTQAPDPALVSRLSTVLAEARSRLTGTRSLSVQDVLRFFLVTLPLAFHRVRWWTVGVMAGFLVVSVVAGWWFTASPAVQASVGTPEQLRQYAEEAFAAYYSNNPAPDFAAQVWTNNAWIAFQAIGGGITGAFPLWVMWSNAVAVGQAGGIMATYSDLSVFFGLILPHGLLELTAIFVAGGAGLKLFWAWVAPGRRSRLTALREEGLAIIVVALGLVFVLAVSGVIEGFVTPSPLPTAVKLAIGALALAGYWAYTLILGGRAARDGETVALAEERGGYQRAEVG